jgi:hypothetical protein
MPFQKGICSAIMENKARPVKGARWSAETGPEKRLSLEGRFSCYFYGISDSVIMRMETFGPAEKFRYLIAPTTKLAPILRL